MKKEMMSPLEREKVKMAGGNVGKMYVTSKGSLPVEQLTPEQRLRASQMRKCAFAAGPIGS